LGWRSEKQAKKKKKKKAVLKAAKDSAENRL
jgi:hypothetical protein